MKYGLLIKFPDTDTAEKFVASYRYSGRTRVRLYHNSTGQPFVAMDCFDVEHLYNSAKRRVTEYGGQLFWDSAVITD